MKTLIKASLSSLLLITALPCLGESKSYFGCGNFINPESGEKAFTPCFYAGAGLGASFLAPDTSDSSWRVDKSNDLSFKAYIGYHFAQDWFTEIAYADLGEARFSSNRSLIEDEESIHSKTPSFFVGYFLPFDEWLNTSLPIDTFVKVGVASISSSSSSPLLNVESKDSILPAMGIGLEWAMLERWYLRSEYERFSADAGLLSLSVNFRFGGQRYQTKEIPPEAVVPIPVIAEAIEVAQAEQTITDTQCFNEATEGCSLFYAQFKNSIRFDSNSKSLESSSYKLLTGVVDALKKVPHLDIEIQAHTDSIGSETFNQNLSENRARSVYDYLVSHGINESRLSSKGFGESQPRASNDTLEGRSLNRRVDFVVTKVNRKDLEFKQ
ncbi:MAG: OmpA family protein [Pseudomonadales bacterium]|nr:OmpA family protein [Pseudomonadales bacterium]